jgi:OOP family OmpA-OmpF porin
LPRLWAVLAVLSKVTEEIEIMRRTGTLAAALLAAAALTGAADARAADPGFYVGGLVGASSFDVDQGELDTLLLDAFAGAGVDVTAASSSLDDNDTGFGAVVGYRFLPWLAAEARYVDLGEATYDARGTLEVVESAPIPIDLRLKAGVKGPALSVLGILPFADRFEVYARGEVLFAETELEATATVAGDSESESDSTNSTEFGVGVGVGANLGEHWAVRAEYERFLDVGDEDDTGEGDVDLASLQVLYRF